MRMIERILKHFGYVKPAVVERQRLARVERIGASMTACELMSILAEVNPDATICYNGAGYWMPLEDVEWHEDEDGVEVYLS